VLKQPAVVVRQQWLERSKATQSSVEFGQATGRAQQRLCGGAQHMLDHQLQQRNQLVTLHLKRKE